MAIKENSQWVYQLKHIQFQGTESSTELAKKGQWKGI